MTQPVSFNDDPGEAGEGRRYAVVLLTGSQCEAYPGTTCVMSVLGPYTREEADRVLGRQPAWAAPHRMVMNRDEELRGIAGRHG